MPSPTDPNHLPDEWSFEGPSFNDPLDPDDLPDIMFVPDFDLTPGPDQDNPDMSSFAPAAELYVRLTMADGMQYAVGSPLAIPTADGDEDVEDRIAFIASALSRAVYRIMVAHRKV